MTVRTGLTAQLYVDTGGGTYVDIGKVTNFTLTYTREALDTTGIGERHRSYLPGMRDCKGSGSLLYDPDDSGTTTIMNHILNDDETLVGVRLDFDATPNRITGNAVISSVGAAVSVGQLTTVSIEVMFSGKPTGDF